MSVSSSKYSSNVLLGVLSACLVGCSSGDTGATQAETAALSDDSRGPTFSYEIPGARERFEITREIVADKLDRALLPAMRNHGIDMWIVMDRENNSDPLHTEIGGGFAGVRAAYIFFDDGSDQVEKIYLGSHSQPKNSVISQVYDITTYYGYSREGLTPHLQKVMDERDPERIGVNTSHTLPEADGLTVGLQRYLVDTIGETYASRIVSAELLVRDFRLERTERESAVYRQLLTWSAQWMEEALSSRAIEPGVTTAEDIAWWLQDRALELGVTGGGTVRVVRNGDMLPVHDPDMPVEPGDILNIDGGLDYLGYQVDIKRTAYILKPGETALPESLLEAWNAAQRIGEVYAANMQPGRIGHEVWQSINEEAEARGYKAVGPDTGSGATVITEPEVGVYGHSVGNEAHDIGARIAADIPFAYGDRVRFPLANNEWVSVEFHVSTPVPEWDGKTWYTRFEETAQVTPDGVEWMIPIQNDVFLIE